VKERKRKELMGWDNDYLHYTNKNSRFGDTNLLALFMWAKKLDKEGLTCISREELEVRNRQKQEENCRELKKVSVLEIIQSSGMLCHVVWYMSSVKPH
jgi:hypothetical protein